MKRILGLQLAALVVWLWQRSDLAAQSPAQSRVVEVPNAMSVHTWFIIVVVAAFLGWAISYSAQLQKESAAMRRGRRDLLQIKEALLDRIADVENRREAGALADAQYKHQMKELRQKLGRVLDMLRQKTEDPSRARPRS